MDLSFSEEQEMLRKMARDFFANKCPKSLVREMAEDDKGYTPELWKEMASLGWMGLAIPEQCGGMGSFFDLCILLEEMGRACLPGPFVSGAVGGFTILEAGSKEQKKKWLPLIAQGEIIVTLALTEPSACFTPDGIEVAATVAGDAFVIEGTKLFVPDANVAHYLIVATRTDKGVNPEAGISLFMIDAKTPGIAISVLKTIAGDKQCEVVFDKVKVPASAMLGARGKGWIYIHKVLQKAAIGMCAQMVGGAQQVLEMTIQYAKERVQFDKPIGSFQAVQHHCANMVTDVNTCWLMTYQAAWMLSEGMPCAEEVAMAKAWTSEAFRRVSSLGHQIHGGIGFTEDHDMPLYSKRAKAWELAFGDADFHREAVASMLVD